jgi:aminoglycoside 6'-N-acetyltransferase I
MRRVQAAPSKSDLAVNVLANAVRSVRRGDEAEWHRMRMALWPGSDPDEQKREIEHFLADPPLPPLPDLHAAFVSTRAVGGLCGLVEVAIHSEAPGCVTDRIGYLEAWFVDSDYRRLGIGRALAEMAEEWARSQGCSEMASDTDPSYPTSPAAHAALGYGEVQRSFRKVLDVRGSRTAR